MAIFRCKMCGGDLEIVENASSCTCDFCGTQQTVPTVKDENLQGLFNRANVLRMKSEFDKAEEIYEKILQSSSTEAEAYWGLILCKYGIEYVEDPSTFKRIPTCHRASYESITADVDYKNALQYADVQQRMIYESEAKTIEEVQKGIMALVANEKPYDVFICYKETDENGKRTQDSVIANDIYYQLTQEGFKVFYAAITLEDKLGTEYEPYIFSALNTAKVMLALGTKPEYFNAVWVKNEWSRFLKIMKKDRSKMLIPCYRDMDAYELPEEFAHLQAQDMSKIGFINDVVRGIKKVVIKENEATNETVVVQQTAPANSNIQALLDRGNMAIEDEEWEKADGFFEEVLNQDAKCAEAYFGKLLARCGQSNIGELTKYYISEYEEAESEFLDACPEATNRIDYSVSKYMIQDYLAEQDIRELYNFDRKYSSELSCRKEQKSRLMSELANEKLLVRAKQYASGATALAINEMVEDVAKALDLRISDAQRVDNEKIASLKDLYEAHLNSADKKAQELHNQALARQEATYNSRVAQMNEAQTILQYERVRNLFREMHGYKDTLALADSCQAEIDRLKKEERLEKERREAARRKEAERLAKKRMITIIAATTIVVCIVIYLVVTKVIIPSNNYNKAVDYMNDENYMEAIERLEAIGDYKDSEDLIVQIQAKSDFLPMASVGDTVAFGNYEGNTEWKVLAKENGKILLISKYALEMRPYNTEYTSVTWESCTLRTWLNGAFISATFSSDEQALILSTNIENSDNAEYGTNGGNNTTDKVFLLSIDEAKKYFTSDADRQATLTDGTSVWWWLRSSGNDSGNAASVSSVGSILVYGYGVNYETGAVRPALWIDVSNL